MSTMDPDVMAKIFRDAQEADDAITRDDANIEALKDQLKVAKELREEHILDLRGAVSRNNAPLLTNVPG